MNRFQLFNTNRPCDVISHWHQHGYLNMSPPYQRGEVWGDIRRRNLIKSIVSGIPIASIIINDRSRSKEWGDAEEGFLAVIDGKQRMTAVLAFMESKFRVPGEWFGVAGSPTFSELPIGRQRGFKNHPLAFSEGSLVSLEDEIEVFELVNFGGVPQGESDHRPGARKEEG